MGKMKTEDILRKNKELRELMKEATRHPERDIKKAREEIERLKLKSETAITLKRNTARQHMR